MYKLIMDLLIIAPYLQQAKTQAWQILPQSASSAFLLCALQAPVSPFSCRTGRRSLPPVSSGQRLRSFCPVQAAPTKTAFFFALAEQCFDMCLYVAAFKMFQAVFPVLCLHFWLYDLIADMHGIKYNLKTVEISGY